MAKLYYTLKETAFEMHLKVHVVRFWCDYFGYGNKRADSTFRMYRGTRRITATERTMLHRIKKLWRTGFYTLAGIEHQLKRHNVLKDLYGGCKKECEFFPNCDCRRAWEWEHKQDKIKVTV